MVRLGRTGRRGKDCDARTHMTAREGWRGKGGQDGEEKIAMLGIK